MKEASLAIVATLNHMNGQVRATVAFSSRHAIGPLEHLDLVIVPKTDREFIGMKSNIE